MNHSTLSHLTAEEQIKMAIFSGRKNADFVKKYPEMIALSSVAVDEGATAKKIGRARIDGNVVKAIADARRAGMPEDSVETIILDKALTAEAAASKLGEVTKSAVAPLGNTTPNLVYPRQARGVVSLVPVVTKPLVTMLAELGAPQLPPEVRVSTQAALLAASEVAEGNPYPAAAPGVDFVLNGIRKFGLILAFSDVLLNADNEGNVISFVQTNLENAANNAIDAAMVASLTAAAGTSQTTINAAFDSFHGDLRTACWVGNPQTLAKLRSAQEQNIGPRGGTFYDLPALAVLAMPEGLLFLVDAQRTAVFDGPQIIERSNEADIVMDTAPSGGNTTVTRLFQTNQTAFKITRYADYKLMVNPVAVTVA
ncbi:hypothetical protein [Burkholderia cenocepacia]|uniref:hypothetical protein n=1 Tax=Burkholderia cenocepacia TaxID=95486 RepID=UPI002875AA88|nr:hypothetical protein [Burkholderia cenocepacia]MDS0850500.1 hypothetical protein [Burkholderia cenocepacia]